MSAIGDRFPNSYDMMPPVFSASSTQEAQTFLVGDKRYKVCKTRPDGACGLHAMLGTSVNGDYFLEGARELFINKLKANLNQPEVQTLLNETLVSYLKEYIQLGNHSSIYIQMIFKTLDNQTDLFKQQLNRLFQRENLLKKEQLEIFNKVLEAIQKLDDSGYKQQFYKILNCSDPNALRQNINFYLNVKDAVHAFLKNMPIGLELNRVSLQLLALNQEREDLYLETIKKKEFIENYFHACLNKYGNYYFTDKDLHIAALLFNRQVSLYSTDFTLTYTFGRGVGVVIYNNVHVNHYSRCEAVDLKPTDLSASLKEEHSKASISTPKANGLVIGATTREILAPVTSVANLNNPRVVESNRFLLMGVQAAIKAPASGVVARVDLAASTTLKGPQVVSPQSEESDSKVTLSYSMEFSKTARAVKISEFIHLRQFDKMLSFLCSLFANKRLNYCKNGEILLNFALKIAVQSWTPKDILRLLAQFHLAGANFKATDQEGIGPQHIVQASSWTPQVKEDMRSVLKMISSDYFAISAEFSSSKKATKLHDYIDKNKNGLISYLRELNSEGKLQYVKHGETLLNHFLKGSIHWRTPADVLFVIEAFHTVRYSFNFSDAKGIVPFHIVICSSIPIVHKLEILGRLVEYGASCEDIFTSTTVFQVALRNLEEPERSPEWLKLILFLLKNGTNPNGGVVHPLTLVLASSLDLSVKSKLTGAFLQADDLDETAIGTNKNSLSPVAEAITQLMNAENDEAFAAIFQYALPIIMRNADQPEKQKILRSLIEKAYETDPSNAQKIVDALNAQCDENNQYYLFKILLPLAPLSKIEILFRKSKSELIINDLTKAFQLSPNLFNAIRHHKDFSNPQVLEILRAIDMDQNLSASQKEQISHFILRMGIKDKSTVSVLLFNIGNLKNYFGENFKSNLLTFLLQIDPTSISLSLLNQVLNRLIDLDRHETKTFSTQHEIFNVLRNSPSEWISRLENLAARIYHAKYPEKPLEEVIANFKKVEFGLPDQELQDLANCYRQILKYSLENKVQDYSPADIARCLKALNSKSKTDFKYDPFIVRLALIRQAIFKSEGYLPFNTQVLVAIALLRFRGKGRLAQVNTGEGKSVIVAMIAAYHSLTGNLVDIVTTSDSLAIRDAQGKSAFFKILGLNVKHNCIEDQTHEACYNGAHIVYGTPYRFECAILYDLYGNEIVRGNRQSDVVIVDEVDSMFLDKGSHSTRLIFADSRFDGLFWVYYEILRYVKNDEKVTTESVRKLLLNSEHYDTSTEFVKEKINSQLSDWVESAKTALYRFAENKNYAVKDGEILPVDFKHTGAFEFRTRYSNGLHQFLEIKHKLVPKPERSMGCCISHVSFFLRYNVILGLSGSLGANAERHELRESFQLDTFDVPPHKDGSRTDHETLFTADKSKWLAAIKEDVLKQVKLGRAVLVIFETIQQTLDFKTFLNYPRAVVLNGSQTIEEEENIIAMAGASQMVTIATNKAGRGMDIRTTPQTDLAGGLHVDICFFALNKRVEKQLKGRTRRMGKVGTVLMILNCSYEGLDKDWDFQSSSNKSDRLMLLETRRTRNEIRLSKERMEIVIPMAKHIDAFVLDFCSKLPALKMRYNKHEVKGIKERWAEWLSQIDDSDTSDVTDVEKWKANATAKHRIFMESLQKSLKEGSIIQNPDIFVAWGNELSGLAAIEKYSQALRLNPSHAQAYLQRGYNYKTMNIVNATKDFQAAVTHFTNYIKHNPTKSEYFEGRGRARSELGQHRLAEQDFAKVIVLNSGSLSAYLGRAEALGKLNQWDAAIRDYNEAIVQTRKKGFTNDGQVSVFRRIAIGLRDAQQYKDALSLSLEALSLPITNVETAWRLNVFVGSIYTDDYQDAKRGIVYFQRALDLVPQDESLKEFVSLKYYNLGIDYFNEGNQKDAILQYQTALKLIVKDQVLKCKICNNIAVSLKILGDTQQAINYFKWAMEADPTNSLPEDSLASLYLEQGDLADEYDHQQNALAYYKLAEGIMKDRNALYTLYNNTGVVYKKLNQYGSAINYYEAAIKLKPEEVLAKKNLTRLFALIASAKIDEGNPDEALTYCNKGLNLDLDDTKLKCSLYNIAGLALKDLHQYERAIANFQEVIALDPLEDAPRCNLSNVYLKLADAADSEGQHRTAVDYYTLGMKTGTQDVEVMSILNHNLGILYRKLDMFDNAIPYLERAIQLDGRSSSKLCLASIYCNKGAELFNSGNKFQARAMFQRAQRYNPTDATISANLLLTYR